MAEGRKLPERYFMWLDENGVRCGPRHETMRAALNFFKLKQKPPDHPGYENKYPSNKDPHKLIVAELIERDMTKEEAESYEMWKKLDERGLA